MNKAFTLIELAIVVSIVAIISAVAIPNLLEMKTFAREMHAASELRAVVFPAICQYQNRCATDTDNDGRGEFASHLAILAGACDAGSTGAVNALPTTRCSYLPPEYNNFNGSTGSNCRTYTAGGSDYTDRAVNVDGYEFGVFNTMDGSVPLTTDPTTADGAENFCVVIAAPGPGQPMQTAFAICMNDGYYPRIICTRASISRDNIDIKQLSKFKTSLGIYHPLYPSDPCSIMVVSDTVGVQMQK